MTKEEEIRMQTWEEMVQIFQEMFRFEWSDWKKKVENVKGERERERERERSGEDIKKNI